MFKSDGVFRFRNDQKFPTDKCTEPLFVLGGSVGLACSMEQGIKAGSTLSGPVI